MATRKTNNGAANKSVVSEQSKATSAATKAEEKPIVAKNIDPNQYITVRNGFQGKLIYRGQRTGELFVWEEFGATQEIELRELRNAKNSHKAFFENNWFMFDDDWVIDYLGVRQYYRNAISIENFDDIFTKKPDELKQLISGMSNGQKMSVAYRARALIAEKKVDSLSVISALEEALGVELIEK